MHAPQYSTDTTEIFSSAAIENPQPLFARLRNERPISQIGDTGVHLVATWALIDEALQRDADFSANLTGVLIRGDDGLPAMFELPRTGASQVIATADEPDHAMHRALAEPRLSASRIAELEPTIRRWTEEALESWVTAGGGDFVPVSEVIPARVVALVLGLPDDDVIRYRRWAMMGGDMLAGDVNPAGMIEIATETARIREYLREHLRAAAADPQEGPSAPMLNALARGVGAGHITQDQAIGIALIMFAAGGESTAALIGSAVHLLSADPALADTLRRDPDLISRFVEEAVRLAPPFNFHYRVVRRSCELGGAELREGDRLMLVWAAANRDPAVISDPDTLRLDRRYPKQHMSFGRGAHFCIGAPLARLEARIVVEEVLARTRRLRPRAGAPPVHARSILVNRFERLPLDAERAD